MDKNNNSAGIEINKIKALENELLKNSAGMNGQMSFIFDIEVEKTINGIQMGVLENGVAYLTQTSLAQLCGISRSSLYDIQKAIEEQKYTSKIIKIKDILKEHDYNEKNLFISIKNKSTKNIENAYPDVVCVSLLEYYAFEEKNDTALKNIRILTSSSFRDYIYKQVGYIQQTKSIDSWKHFHDRVDMNYDKVPLGYFSIFKEISGLIISLIKNKVIVDDRTIPDISVGKCWSEYWKNNNLDNEYGKRIKYEHNYPDYYPQAKSNPQNSWIYPDISLGLFRKWFELEYIVSKFPKYLFSKVKNLQLTQEEAEKVLLATKPKQINNETVDSIQKDNLEFKENNNFEDTLSKIIKR